jgi:multiple sugar transport system permease protein
VSPTRVGLTKTAGQAAFLVPAALLVFSVNLYPLLTGIVLSLQSGTLLQPAGFVGLDNFRDLAAMDVFWSTLRFTAVFTVMSVAGSYVLGLGLGLWIYHLPRRGQALALIALVLPWVIPSIVSVIAWSWTVTSDRGLLNQTLGAFGFGPVYFLASPELAGVAVITLKIWRTFPFLLITLLAARRLISPELYDAAAIDGAGRWTLFRHITIPQLSRVSLIGLLFVTIWSFNDFETIFLLTRGGPSDQTQNLLTLAYKETFAVGSPGLGAAIGVASLGVLLVLAFLLLRALREVDR